MLTRSVSPARLRYIPNDARKPTLVLVHGVYHGSWAFESFGRRFVDAGYPVALLDLPGRVGEPRMRVESDVGYADFVHEVERLLETCPGRKIIVGHSLGGLLALSVAHRSDVFGIVAIAMPLSQAIRSKRWRLLREFPWKTLCFAVTCDASHLYHHRPFTDRYLFSRETDESDKRAATARVREQQESRRLFSDIMRLEVHAPPRTIPTLVLWSDLDPTVTEDVAVRLAALTVGTCVMIPRSGHNIMLEPGADVAAHTMLTWLARLDQPTYREELPVEFGGDDVD